MSTITVSVQVESDMGEEATLGEMWAVIDEVEDKAFELVSVRIPGRVAIVGPDTLAELRGEA